MTKENNYSGWIIAISILLPVAIAALFFTEPIEGYDFSFLPVTYAITNGLTFCCLIAGVIAIKNKNVTLHNRLMNVAIGLSIYFLVAYVMYHLTTPSTKYGGEGIIRPIYFALLISHILLSVVTIPLVLISYVRALNKKFDKHKKIAKITFPIWAYVALTGVIIYLMISPYYQ